MILKCKSVILSVLFVTAQMPVSAQPSSDTAASDEVLITLHAEDAFLPGILSILARAVTILSLTPMSISRIRFPFTWIMCLLNRRSIWWSGRLA